MSIIDRIARKAVYTQLEHLEEGRLTLHDSGSTTVFGSGSGPSASVTVHSPSFFTAVALGGHLGAAEAYVEEVWDADDLTELARVFLRNREVLDGLDGGLARLAVPLRLLAHARNRNTKSGSRRNIHAHYDLGNDFFAEFLDETMTYSCGIFDSPGSSLRDASLEKYDRLCRKLELAPGDRLVEIGTGWGGFAVHAAATYGCRVTTTTISDAQRRLATERIARAGLADRIDVIGRDYRDLVGMFDKLVSIEMIEAVGHQYYRAYFDKLTGLLEPDGLAAIQAITIQDRLYETARDQVDFIKRYVFPGSCIPSVSALAGAAAPTDLRLVHLEEIGPHYAETLRRWRSAFHTAWPRILAHGYPAHMRRLWDFYFCYCEAGFDEGILGNVQLVFAKPRAVLPKPFASPWASVSEPGTRMGTGRVLAEAS
jgi:cyclopropane-fatty-acyl-phospholipid synthase